MIQLFRDSGALLEGHFRLTSGLHSPGYLQCALVLQDPARASTLGSAVAALVRPLGITVVLSPALGGIVIGVWQKQTLPLVIPLLIVLWVIGPKWFGNRSKDGRG